MPVLGKAMETSKTRLDHQETRQSRISKLVSWLTTKKERPPKSPYYPVSYKR